ncbi:hypothetical protein WN55_10113 [Dufourea novaeangliae]|uniref:Uncharacterized protein n=1 Tax=Dufourea novaeangliae TaxID=178035 RepID=A0A154P4F6_DUFNO|nr:hypothetical protein WN55_10113 [Dufourea novaeangliae]
MVRCELPKMVFPNIEHVFLHCSLQHLHPVSWLGPLCSHCTAVQCAPVSPSVPTPNCSEWLQRIKHGAAPSVYTVGFSTFLTHFQHVLTLRIPFDVRSIASLRFYTQFRIGKVIYIFALIIVGKVKILFLAAVIAGRA